MKRKPLYNRILLIPIIALFSLLLGHLTSLAQIDAVYEQAQKYYRPDTWPKSDKPPVMGLKFDDFEITGFTFKEKKYHPPTGGINYLWYNKREDLDIHIIINVYPNVDEAHEALYQWLIMSVNVPMHKGSFSGNSNIIGDISWVESSSFTIAFIRDNVTVIIHGMTRLSRHRNVIENVALMIDENIKKEYRTPNAADNIKKVSPIIDELNLHKTTLEVNERTQISIIARDPRGGELRYSFHATGGNVLTTKEGFFYQACATGKHTITVYAINPYNLKSRKSVEVNVLK